MSKEIEADDRLQLPRLNLIMQEHPGGVERVPWPSLVSSKGAARFRFETSEKGVSLTN